MTNLKSRIKAIEKATLPKTTPDLGGRIVFLHDKDGKTYFTDTDATEKEFIEGKDYGSQNFIYFRSMRGDTPHN